MLISEQFAAVESSWAHFWDHPFGDELLLTASEGEEVQRMSLTARLRPTSRHPHDIARRLSARPGIRTCWLAATRSSFSRCA